MAKKYIKNIIFSKSNLTGLYRYKNEFQIYPLNIGNAPKSIKVHNIPCCFEFFYEESDIKQIQPFGFKHFDAMISEFTIQANKRNRILNLFSSITNYRFHISGKPEVIWTMHVPEVIDESNKKDVDNYVSTPGMEMYSYPEINDDLKIEKFSKIDINEIIGLPHAEYFMYDPIDGRDKFIKVPLTINKILDKYFSLDIKIRLIIDSAAYQLCNALDLQASMKSLSFFSAVSAIETMVNLEYKNEKVEFECDNCKSIKSSKRSCKKCGKPVWGIGEKFKEFLTNYVSNSENAKNSYKKIYDIRSKIVHTEFLMYQENILDWSFTNKTEEMGMKHIEAIQLARLSIVNWLLKN